MLKDSETARDLSRRTHRTYSHEFKAELVGACQQPGTSVAALALSHGMNANVLHRWLKEHSNSGRHRINGPRTHGASVATSPAPAFLRVALPTAMSEPTASAIKVELRKGALSMTVTWPASAAADFAQWATALLK